MPESGTSGTSTTTRPQTQGLDPVRATDDVCGLMRELRDQLRDYQRGAAANTSKASPIWQNAISTLLQIGQQFGFDVQPVLDAYRST